MAEIQLHFKQKQQQILNLNACPKVKILLLAGLVQQMRQLDLCSRQEALKSQNNFEILSTSVSECQSISYQTERDLEQLEHRILDLQKIRVSKNQQIQQLEEELEILQLSVRAKSERNDLLKRQIIQRMENIQNEKNAPRDERSILNKSIDAVAEIFSFRWW